MCQMIIPTMTFVPHHLFDLDLFPKVTAAALIFTWSEFQKTDNLPPYPVHLILYQFDSVLEWFYHSWS